ncbi:MAG: hypothetical protein ACK4NC_03310 [Candidatus Gracilibacteria bacterium]
MTNSITFTAATTLAFIAVLFYGCQNWILEMKLSQYNPAIILLIAYAVMVPLTLAIYFLVPPPAGTIPGLPKDKDLYWTIGAGLLFFLADILFVTAYGMKGQSFNIGILLMFIPIIVLLIKMITGGIMPNVQQWAGYVFAALAVVLILKK